MPPSTPLWASGLRGALVLPWVLPHVRVRVVKLSRSLANLFASAYQTGARTRTVETAPPSVTTGRLSRGLLWAWSPVARGQN